MIKIVIADDHVIVRKGLKQILEDTLDMKVVDEASSGDELLEKVKHQHFDLVILDISMPGKGGLETLKELKEFNNDIPVLILSIHPEEQYALRVLKAGASGYITKDSAPNELIDAIMKVSHKRKYISLNLAEKLASNLGFNDKRLPHETLSDREYQVLCLLAKGKRIKDIGNELFLSPKTVSTYRNRILEKMGMISNAELTQYAMGNGLIV